MSSLKHAAYPLPILRIRPSTNYGKRTSQGVAFLIHNQVPRSPTLSSIHFQRAGLCYSRDRNAKKQNLPGPSQPNMATDDDYMDFLNKANQDADSGKSAAAQSKGPAQFKAQDSGSDIPKAIKAVCKDAFYVSEADEPFQGVSLKWTGAGDLPDEVEFAKLINHWDADNADISILDPTDWDEQGRYTNVIDAVREATRGNDVRVYRVVRDKTRVEYWVVSNDGGKIVGAKALGVES